MPRFVDAALAAVSIYSVEGTVMFGRIGFGVMGDRFGASKLVRLLVQAFGALGYFFARDLGQFYAVLPFGFIYAGIMPLYAAGAREFPDEDDGDDHGRHRHGGQSGDGDWLLGGWI